MGSADQQTAAFAPRPFREWSRVRCAGSSDVLWHDDSLSPALVEALQSEPESLMSSGPILKDGDRSTVVVVPADGHEYVLKRFNARNIVHSALHISSRTRARWNIINSFRLLDAGIAVPTPRAMRQAPPGMRRTQSWFLCDRVAGPTLEELNYGDQNADGVDDVMRAAHAFADVWRRLGKARLRHDDLKSSNMILDDDDRLCLMDLDGMRRITAPPLHARYRRKDRRRFLNNWPDGSRERSIYAQYAFARS